jgi:hypothetical protein
MRPYFHIISGVSKPPAFSVSVSETSIAVAAVFSFVSVLQAFRVINMTAIIRIESFFIRQVFIVFSIKPGITPKVIINSLPNSLYTLINDRRTKAFLPALKNICIASKNLLICVRF